MTTTRGTERHVLFYSANCVHCQGLLAQLARAPAARSAFVLVCVDTHRARLPPYVDRVPMAMTAAPHSQLLAGAPAVAELVGRLTAAYGGQGKQGKQGQGQGQEPRALWGEPTGLSDGYAWLHDGLGCEAQSGARGDNDVGGAHYMAFDALDGQTPGGFMGQRIECPPDDSGTGKGGGGGGLGGGGLGGGGLGGGGLGGGGGVLDSLESMRAQDLARIYNDVRVTHGHGPTPPGGTPLRFG